MFIDTKTTAAANKAKQAMLFAAKASAMCQAAKIVDGEYQSGTRSALFDRAEDNLDTAAQLLLDAVANIQAARRTLHTERSA